MNCRGSLNAAAQCDLLDDDYEQPRIADDNTTSGERSATAGSLPEQQPSRVGFVSLRAL
jgi:hypothetical protein